MGQQVSTNSTTPTQSPPNATSSTDLSDFDENFVESFSAQYTIKGS